jgi:hypothetical protein
MSRFAPIAISAIRVQAAAAGLALFALAGCGSRPPSAAPGDFSIIRQYGWDCDVADPQAAWSPNDYRVAARSANGFIIVQDETGQKPAETYRSVERRESHFLAWINPDQVVFGPDRNADKLADGRVVAVPEGLTVVTIGRAPQQRQLTKLGYHPRVGQGHIFAQAEDRLLRIDETGAIEEFGRGFLPEPQRVGDGVAWQETPVLSDDWWTGKPVRSNLIIRWKSGRADQLPAGVQPCWSADGGLAATTLRADPQPGQYWWKAGSDVVFIAGPGRPAVLVARDARDPAPHPTQPVIAVSTNEGKVALVSRDGAQRVDIADGCNPHWSWDGTRLLIEQAPPETPPLPTMPGARGRNHLTVLVLAVKAVLKQ